MLASIPLNLHLLLIRWYCDEHKFGFYPGQLPFRVSEETSADREYRTFIDGLAIALR
ncbi:hypothetical protein [Oscillatoria acuminata]|uniref:hypothetical protein n=1 Tax=Oscillatoria acuminata TaxID=118323 RepID=UPI0012EAC477|nr:hypothetical protein [Oscillatoria acuminata]